jgi:predicted RNA methylase
MNLVLPGMENEARNHDLSQWFTPRDLAKRVVEWAIEPRVSARDYDGHGRALRVLEPSAGNGALVRPLVAAGAFVTAIEVDERYLVELRTIAQPLDLWVRRWDFLHVKPEDIGSNDLCVMNPPYEDGLDVAFVLHALKFAPRVVGVFRSAIVHGDERYETLWRWVDITRGKWLRKRPQFGTGPKADGARSDFCVLDLVARERPRKVDEDMNLSFGWW